MNQPSFTASRAKQQFGELLKAAANGPVAIEHHGKVRAIVVAPEHFHSARTSQPDAVTERKLARLSQTLVERDRLIRHQNLALQLLTLPAHECTQLLAQAQAMVTRWREERLCSADYIDRWSHLLALPLPVLAQTMVADMDGWGTALRQNSPWVGQLA
jgi:hypothetical protein